MESGTTLHCPDYSEDVTLRKQREGAGLNDKSEDDK